MRKVIALLVVWAALVTVALVAYVSVDLFTDSNLAWVSTRDTGTFLIEEADEDELLAEFDRIDLEIKESLRDAETEMVRLPAELDDLLDVKEHNPEVAETDNFVLEIEKVMNDTMDAYFSSLRRAEHEGDRFYQEMMRSFPKELADL